MVVIVVVEYFPLPACLPACLLVSLPPFLRRSRGVEAAADLSRIGYADKGVFR